MDSKRWPVICLVLLLSGCGWWNNAFNDNVGPQHDKGYGDSTDVSYWYSTHITADNAPDVIKSQKMLEDDLVQCGYEKRDYQRWAHFNDPVSTLDGDVVDQHGDNRADTDLPNTYELSDCMHDKGWVRLKHYYTDPY